jgi:glycosyltransferase involved in cell wall biosynthesis
MARRSPSVDRHVGLNLLHLVPAETGGSEIYARCLVPALLGAAPQLRLTLFCSTEAFESLEAEPWSGAVELVEIPVRARSRARRVVAEQVLLPRATRRSRLDLLHNMMTTAPAFPGTPQVTTILDLIYKRYPEAHSPLLRAGMSVLVPISARRSQRVITISRAAKRDLIELLGVAPERIDVTYPGPGLPEGVTPLSEEEVRRNLDVDERPLILSVSAKRPHKNLGRLFAAVSGIEEHPAPVLVIPGYSTEFEPRLRSYAASLPGGDRVRFTGWVDAATLEGLYRAAACFVLPSLAEGFGLPVLEAMLRGVPVACSNASSIPEVAGEAALYFDPTDTNAIRAAISTLLVDGPLRERLRQLGYKQARKFTWEKTARATLESYERALDER